ncbi:hypothetical protein [Roseixanthobacter pseudopolyaromaticivorans]|uniref:hypothetical protein n=1 Tax=Xanthobacteraceae TaxID=335928 RepID=UPI003728081B
MAPVAIETSPNAAAPQKAIIRRFIFSFSFEAPFGAVRRMGEGETSKCRGYVPEKYFRLIRGNQKANGDNDF